jgi:hypothetical protein
MRVLRGTPCKRAWCRRRSVALVTTLPLPGGHSRSKAFPFAFHAQRPPTELGSRRSGPRHFGEQQSVSSRILTAMHYPDSRSGLLRLFASPAQRHPKLDQAKRRGNA